jgi:hypothetical protein
VQTLSLYRNILAACLDIVQTIGLFRNILAAYLDVE